MASQTPAEQLHKLTELSSLGHDAITATLRDRFFGGLNFTYISESTLVSVNPYAAAGDRNSDDVLRQYARQYRTTSRMARGAGLPPHIFSIACEAFFYMHRTGQDQSILLTGETSSGKTELRRLAIRALINLSAATPGKKGSKLAIQIPSGQHILESMGNARTLENGNASRYGSYTELQFSDAGKLVGSKTLDYYLERSRLVAAGTGDGTFHIFYALVAGASAEERQHLRIGESSDYKYLGATRHKAALREDQRRFDRLKQAFKNVGLSQRNVASICQVLAAILHLGNIEFIQDNHRTQDAASVRDRDSLHHIAALLGVEPERLEEALANKTKMIRGEICTIVLDADGAAANRDELSKSLYSLLFAWITEHLNSKFCRDDFDSFISILDFPGPQTASIRNGLDQFCINFANERLHKWILQNIFEKKRSEYSDEGISNLSPDVPYFDNAECVRLIVNQPGGLVHIMDDQARRMPKKSDHTMVEAFGKRWGNHPNFKLGPADRAGFVSFTISHFHGPVTYTSQGWLEHNAEFVNADFVSLLSGGADVRDGKSALASPLPGQGSTVPFVRGLFKSEALKKKLHPRNEQTVVAAYQSVKPTRAPSTRKPNRPGTIRRPGTIKRRNGLGSDADDDSDVGEGEEKDGNDQTAAASIQGIAGDFRSALDTLFETFEDTKMWTVFCIRPNDNHLPNQFEGRLVKQQIQTYCLTEMARKLVNEYCVAMTHEEFCERYSEIPSLAAVQMQGSTGGQAKGKFADAREVMSWTDSEAVGGRMKIFLSHQAFRELEDELRGSDPEEIRLNESRAQLEADAAARGDVDSFSPLGGFEESSGYKDSPDPNVYGNPFNNVPGSSSALPLFAGDTPTELASGFDDSKSAYTDWTALRMDSASALPPHQRSASIAASETYAPSRDMFAANPKGLNEKSTKSGERGQVAEQLGKETMERKIWVRLTYMLTGWIPGSMIGAIGRLKRPDVRMAWREKLAINMMIWFVCCAAVFVIAALGDIICPKEHLYTTSELSEYTSDSQAYTAIRGEVFDLTNIITMHSSVVSVVSSTVLMDYAGTDATSIFPVQVNALCNGVNGSVSPWVQLSAANETDANSQYHDFRDYLASDVRPDWYYESMWLMRSNYRVGFVGYTNKLLKNLVSEGNNVAVYNGDIYDLTDYVSQGSQGVIESPAGTVAPDDTDASFMSSSIVQLFTQKPGADITDDINALDLDPEVLARQQVCLRNLFFIGKKSDADTPRCEFSGYLLLALSLFMVAIIGFKFLAALQFGRARKPENYDRFVICQVPCYTEGEESMRKTIDSLAALRYDDKRKLILVICDGNIVGSGNDRPTPRIVLDILGADPNLDPEPLSFLSIGEGSKQHNMAKIYSGLYEFSGHVVPYLVVVKVGKPTETHRPGNRGKRDSQLVLMRFLNKVHFGTAMNPMELEIYHHIKNIIGVNPSFYEYLFQVDADTTVDPDSLGHFVSAFINDKRVIGLCGETALANAKQSFTTMLQVYEYYISHYLSKAFESLFGSVSCLPGCFSCFRLRSPDSHKPLFISNEVVDAYSENRVDTLHTKNLLTLGEDRYLTTLILKFHGNYKTIFVRAGLAFTVAPDSWAVLLSQRRRWINSTIHNLFELTRQPGLCGFCCFSMRFVVMIDLVSTIVAPVTVVYLVYLVILVATGTESLPTTSLIMLAAIYGLQAVIFLLNRKFEMIGWMVIYIIGIPLWAFFLPLYSFWHMDDFSWGNTRVVTGEAGQKVVIHDEGTFDPSEIPLQTWEDYENDLWERNSAQSIGDILAQKRHTMMGGASTYGDQSRPGSLYGGKRSGSIYGDLKPDTMYEGSLYGNVPVMARSGSYAQSIGAQSMLPGASAASYDAYNSARHSTYSLGNFQHSPSQPQLYGHGNSFDAMRPGAVPLQGTHSYPGQARESYISPSASMFGLPQTPSASFSTSQVFENQPLIGGQTPPFTSISMGPRSRSQDPNGDRGHTRNQSSFGAFMGAGTPGSRGSPFDESAGRLLGSGTASPSESPLARRQSRPRTGSTVGTTGAIPVALPSDEVITRDLRNLVASCDLNTVSMKQIRKKLANLYGVPNASTGVIQPADLSSKKEWIGRVVEQILAEEEDGKEGGGAAAAAAEQDEPKEHLV